MKKVPLFKLFICVVLMIQAYSFLSQAQSIVTKAYVEQYVLSKHDIDSIDAGKCALTTVESLSSLMENEPQFERSMQKLDIVIWILTLVKWSIIFFLVVLLKFYMDKRWSCKYDH